MARPRLEDVEELFHQVAALERQHRSTFLDERCAGNPELRAAVEELLHHDPGPGRTDTFLASPIARGPASACDPNAPTNLPATAGLAPTSPSIPGYEVLGEIGRGGMGVVFKARQLALNRLVALKMLLTGSPVSTAQLTRFRTEAEALARLQHPNVVQIYDVGEWEGRPFFSMEYVAGPSLGQTLDGRPQDVRDSATLVEVLARTVHVVHRCGILHRDLKPANILLQGSQPQKGTKSTKEETGAIEPRESGSTVPLPSLFASFVPFCGQLTPKISDFGLAKDQTSDPQLTPSGLVMGTPCYMAPEQARGEVGTLGPAADIYSLGAVLYELVTGRPPFEEATPAQTIAQALAAEPVAPRRLRPELPRDLETICLKCLEKEPTKRYASALDLADDLRRFLAGEPIRARPVRTLERCWRWCRRRPVVAALLGISAALAMALVVSVLVYNARLERALARAEHKADESRQFLIQINVASGVHDLEEGDSLTALLWLTEALRLDTDDPERTWRHRTRIATTLRQCPALVRLLVLDEVVLCTRLGPGGGRTVTAGADHRLHVWDVMTGTSLSLKHPAAVVAAALSPDVQTLATASADGTVRIWDLNKGALRRQPLPQGEAVNRLAFDAGGRVLLTRRADFRVQLWDLAPGKRLPLSGLPAGELRYSTFSADGLWVFTLDAALTGRVWEVATGKMERIPLEAVPRVTQAAFSPDGRRIALAGPDHMVQVWEVAGGRRLGQPLRHPGAVTRLSFSPGGKRLLTAGADQAARVWSVATGEPLTPPLRHHSVVTEARFSPDGRLVVTASEDNTARVWDAVTGAARTPPLKHNGSVAYAAFSADSRQVITSGKDNTVRLWELPRPAGTGISDRRLKKWAASAQVRGPGGRVIQLDNGSVVQVADAATGAALSPPLRHRSVVIHAAFSPDGRRVVTASDDNTARVWNADTGQPLGLPLPHKGNVLYAAFSSDGRRVITAGADQAARLWDAATGEPLTPPLRHRQPVVRAFLSRDGRRAFTVCAGGKVKTWDLTPAERPVSELVLLAQVLAGGRIERGSLVPLEVNHLRSAWRRLHSRTAPAPPVVGR